MKLSIIETGQPPQALGDEWPTYPVMFADLLRPHRPDLAFETISIMNGDALPDPSSLDAVLITGSPAGVYDDTPWMQPLFQFIRAATAVQLPQVGICFGHQAIACALGADVGKSEKGWGIGRHTYDVLEYPIWMRGFSGRRFSLGVSHQDQVKSLPAGARCIARSDFCNFAALDYPEARAISFQGHPEYSPGFSCALYGVRRGRVLSEDSVDQACASLETPVDNALVGGWISNFISS